MKKYITYLFPIFTIILSSCEKYIEVELPPHVPKFIINAQLEPGIPVMVFVTQSRGILQDSNFSPVRDATVEIIEDGEKSYFLEFRGVEQTYWTVNGYVSDELKIKAGKTYEVIVSGRMETARSKVTVPNPVALKSVEIQQGNDNMSEITIIFDDPQERNFYEFNVSFSAMRILEGWGGTIDTVYHTGDIGIEPLNPVYKKNYNTRGKVLLDDGLFNGREARLQFSGNFNFLGNMEIKMIMRSVTEDYFKYYSTLNLQNQVSGDPLATPVQVFSNIEGGRGIFIGAAKTEYVKKVSFTFD